MTAPEFGQSTLVITDYLMHMEDPHPCLDIQDEVISSEHFYYSLFSNAAYTGHTLRMAIKEVQYVMLKCMNESLGLLDLGSSHVLHLAPDDGVDVHFL